MEYLASNVWVLYGNGNISKESSNRHRYRWWCRMELLCSLSLFPRGCPVFYCPKPSWGRVSSVTEKIDDQADPPERFFGNCRGNVPFEKVTRVLGPPPLPGQYSADTAWHGDYRQEWLLSTPGCRDLPAAVVPTPTRYYHIYYLGTGSFLAY